MKKFISILILGLIVCIGALAQNESVNLTVKENQTYGYYTGLASDSIGIGDSIFSYVIKITNPKTKAEPYIFVDLDSLRGTADTINVYFQKKTFAGEKFVNADTAIWVNSSSADAVFAPGTNYMNEYYRVYIVGESDEYAVSISAIRSKFKYD